MPTAPPSDHNPLRTCVAYLPRPKEARKRFFTAKQEGSTKGGFAPKMRIPVTGRLGTMTNSDLVRSENRGDIVSEMERTHTLAIGKAKARRDLCNPEMERLAVKATITEDETVREAYRHLFRERARALKLGKEWHDLQRSSYLGRPGFGKNRRPRRLASFRSRILLN